jgi:hypothetical protein
MASIKTKKSRVNAAYLNKYLFIPFTQVELKNKDFDQISVEIIKA